MYFYHGDGFYSSRDLDFFSNRCSMLNQDLLEITRIEKEINGDWLPVIINDKGKFYSLTEITGLNNE